MEKVLAALKRKKFKTGGRVNARRGGSTSSEA